MRTLLVFAMVLSASSAGAAPPNSNADLQKKVEALTKVVEQLNQRVESLESENTTLKTQQKTIQDQQQTIQQDVAAIPPPAPKSNMGTNPDIGVVIDVVGDLTEKHPGDLQADEGFDRLGVREFELNIGNDIDPFTRLDATLTWSDAEGPDIEEAYVSYSDLPLDIWGRAGRFRLPIGLSNGKHRDQLYTVDEPLMVRRYLGAEGLFRSGVEFSRFLPQFTDSLTQQVRWGVAEGGIGDGGTLFSDSRQNPTYFVHLRNDFVLAQNDYLTLGQTFLAGSGETVNTKTDVYGWGADAEYQHRFDQNRLLTVQADALLQDRDHAYTRFARKHPLGYYLLADYRASQHWEFGGRYDHVQLANYDPFDLSGKDPANYPYNFFRPNPDDSEQSFSAWITFHQSEFALWRLQYDHLDYANGLGDDQLRVQGTFVVGWHQHAVK